MEICNREHFREGIIKNHDDVGSVTPDQLTSDIPVIELSSMLTTTILNNENLQNMNPRLKSEFQDEKKDGNCQYLDFMCLRIELETNEKLKNQIKVTLVEYLNRREIGTYLYERKLGQLESFLYDDDVPLSFDRNKLNILTPITETITKALQYLKWQEPTRNRDITEKILHEILNF